MSEPQLVFVHGRHQQGKDPDALAEEWVDAFRAGLAKLDLDVPITRQSIHFPYYGNTLRDLDRGRSGDDVASVIYRGSETASEDEKAFLRTTLLEVLANSAIPFADLEAAVPVEVVERGPQNWPWIRAMLQALDALSPDVSAAAVALMTSDVYHYLTNLRISAAIDQAVAEAMEPRLPTVVVAHSLGSVVGYRILKRMGDDGTWSAPLLVTLGSPLGISTIRRRLAPVSRPGCVGEWFNAMDPVDVVSLFPLDAEHFPTDPPVDNKIDVRNETSNHHGIEGYLSDPDVAQRIFDGLVAARTDM